MFLNPLYHSPDLVISLESTSSTKKYKKTSTGKHASGKESWDLQDQAALNRRAERFKREHQIERQRWVGNGQSSFHHSDVNAHQDVFSPTPSSGNWDEPENSIVKVFKDFLNWRLTWNCRPHNTRLSEPVKSYSRTTFDSPLWVLVVPSREYSRSTTPQEPDPKKIRPYSVLRETVDQLKNRWKQKENYNWICSQFKSVRQDLTVSSSTLLVAALTCAI